jgi:hypothetical protein
MSNAIQLGSPASGKPPQVICECPGCSQAAQTVKPETMVHHIDSPWKYDLQDAPYYFCSQADCDIVYFNNSGVIFQRNQVRTPDDILCYCYGVTEAEVLNELKSEGKSAIREFIARQTKLGACHCEVTNPSGRCCLSSIPREPAP